jgi:hypothetical protein
MQYIVSKMIRTFENIIGGVIGIWILLTTCALTYIIINNIVNLNTHIFAIGPNPDFYILGICIDTPSKYCIVVFFCFINSGMRAMNGNVLHSWVINEIQGVKNKTIINTNKAYTLSFISIIYNWFDFFMYMNILMSQIDMLLIEIIADLMVTVCLIKHYLKLKQIDT